jgi:hypothetical protein
MVTINKKSYVLFDFQQPHLLPSEQTLSQEFFLRLFFTVILPFASTLCLNVQLILEILSAPFPHVAAHFRQRVVLPTIAEHIKLHGEIHQASYVHLQLLFKTLNMELTWTTI